MANLIDTTAELKRHYSAITEELSPESIRSYLDDADIDFIIPAVGRDTFDLLVAGKLGFESGSPEQQAVLLLQKAAVNFAIAAYVNSGAVNISNAGISVVKNNNRLPASDKKLVALKRDCLDAGFKALEKTVDFLEENLTTFTNYADSQEHKNNRALFINSATEFQKAGINIANSANLYQTLRTYQIQVELDKIEPIIGTTITADVRNAVLNNNANEIQTKLLNKIKPIVASFTMHDALVFLAVSISPNGVFQNSTSIGGISGNTEITSAADSTLITLLSSKMKSQGEKQILELTTFLKDNATDYGYTVPEQVLLNDDPNSNVYMA